MKKSLLVLLLVSLKFYCQPKTLYIELTDNFTVTNENISMGGFSIDLKIKSKSSNDTDYYTFFISTEIKDKPFEETGERFSIRENISYVQVDQMPFCDLHTLLSKERMLYLVKKDAEGNYKIWLAFYQGTFRNIVKTKL